MRISFKKATPAIILLAITMLVFGRCIGHEFLLSWDDVYYVATNRDVKGIYWNNIQKVFTSYYVGNYAPVQMLSYMLDFEIWKDWPGGYLLTNLLLHAANAAIFYHLLKKLSPEPLQAWVGSLLFLFHPVQVENVVWISQRKTVLAMFFFLIAWHCYLQWRDSVESEKRRLTFYILSLFSFLLAVLSKSVTVIFPAMLIAADLLAVTPDKNRRWLDKLPFIFIAAGAAVMALVSQQPGNDGGRAPFHGGTPLATFLTMLTVLCRYLGMIIFPAGLSPIYDPVIHKTLNLRVSVAIVVIAILVISVIHVSRRKPAVGFWGATFVLALLPVSQIVPLVTLMNDRYLYFPMLAVGALAGAGAVSLHDRLHHKQRMIALTAGVLLMMALSFASIIRTGVWRNDLTLWKDAYDKNPENIGNLIGLAGSYESAGDDALALELIEKGYRKYPDNVNLIFALGTIYNKLGRLEEAEKLLLNFLLFNPLHVMANAELGTTYERQKRYAEAEKSYNKALSLQPSALQVVMMLGRLALKTGEYDKAYAHFSRVAAEAPEDPDSAFEAARASALAGRTDAALKWIQAALQRGQGDREIISEPAFDKIRSMPEFTVIMNRYQNRN